MKKKILELLYIMLAEATSKPYRYEKTCVTLSYGGEFFTLTGVKNLDLGWKEGRPDEVNEKLIPAFTKGDKLSVDKIFIEKHQTEPPARFTDGKLLQAMEIAGKKPADGESAYAGIGTSATRAEVIEKLVSREFVERVGEGCTPQFFVPTEKAYLLDSVLPDILKSAEMTAEWEAKLSDIENGILDPDVFWGEIQKFIRTIIKG